MPRLTRHCLSVKATIGVESVVKIVIKTPVVKIVIKVVEVGLRASPVAGASAQLPNGFAGASTGVRPWYIVIGGQHLHRLEERNVHCTGEARMRQFHRAAFNSAWPMDAADGILALAHGHSVPAPIPDRSPLGRITKTPLSEVGANIGNR